jgi:hypothetical protein
MFWLSAFGTGIPGAHLVSAFTGWGHQLIGHWKLVSDYSSATASDLHGVPSFEPAFDR